MFTNCFAGRRRPTGRADPDDRRPGADVWDAFVEPFGQAQVFGTPQLDLRLPGQYAEAESNLLQNWNRDYDPSLGHYVEADPLGLAAGQNVYGYVGGDPVSGSDVAGLFDPRAFVKLALSTEAVGGGPEDPIADVAVAAEQVLSLAGVSIPIFEHEKTGTAANCPDRVRIYRAVEPVELRHVIPTRNYGFSPNRSGKYFALSRTRVQAFASSPWNSNRSLTVTSTTIPGAIAQSGFPLDDVGGAGP